MHVSIRSISIRLSFVLLFCACIVGASTYWFLKKTSYGPVTFKTNSIQKLLTTKEHLLGNIWHGMGIYFWNKYLPTWEKGIEPTALQKKEQRKLFHYNLRIEHIVDKDPNCVINHKRPTIYFHGWGDTKNSAKIFKAFGDVLPGDIITFHFRDQGVIIPKLRHANLGQLADILSGLYVLKWAKDSMALDGIDLYGYSRGGATILNMIAVLNDSTHSYDEELIELGIDAKERKELLQLIQNGCIILDCPLTDFNSSVEARMKKFTQQAIKALSGVTKYQPYGLQGLTSTLQYDGLKLNILVHFQYHDTIVSNANDAELYKRLYYFNPKTTYIVLGNDGGHIHTHASLAHTIHTFKKMFGSSYDKQYDAQYQASRHAKTLEKKLLQPGKKIDAILAEQNKQCAEMLKHIDS